MLTFILASCLLFNEIDTLEFIKSSIFEDAIKLTNDSLKIDTTIKRTNFIPNLNSKNTYNKVYVSICIELLKTQLNYKIIDKNKIDKLAEYLGLLDIIEYKKFKENTFEKKKEMD